MQKRYIKLLLVAVFISMLVVLPDQVNAQYIWDDDYDDDESLKIVVDEATYLDYDDDGIEDDILTVFRIKLLMMTGRRERLRSAVRW